MALLASTILTAARDRHPAFSRERVPHAVLLRALTEYQRQLVSRALRRDPAYLAQQASLVFSAQSASGAGTGGFPAAVANDGTVSRAEQPTGYAKELDFAEGTVVVDECVPDATTTTSVTKSGAGWTTDAWVDAYLEVTAGTGVGQRRVITGNTATVASWADALTTALDSTSVVRIVSVASSVSEDVGVVTALPAQSDRYGYLITLDASGTAYLDLTSPLVATLDRGIPLPSAMKTIIGGTVRFTDDTTSVCPLTIGTYAQRFDGSGEYNAYVLGRELFLVGDANDWQSVQSIDLRYVPEPPALTALTDYLLLPDHAEPALVAHAAYVAGTRVQGLDGLPAIDLATLGLEKQEAERTFLNEVSAGLRSTVQRTRELW